MRPHFERHHFERHHRELADSDEYNGGIGTLPETEDIESILDTAFWASLLREERINPKISLVYMEASAKGTLQFERPIPLTPQSLSKLAPAVERPGLHLGLCRDGSGYAIWGVTRVLPPYTLVIEVVMPGLLVVKHSRAESGRKFANLAVLESNRVKVLDPSVAVVPNCPAALTSLMRFDGADSGDSLNVLVELSASMRSHGRGGSLLVIPSRQSAWRDSIVSPVSYPVSPPFSKISYLLQRDEQERDGGPWKSSMERTIATIAGLTAVDGATLITETYDVLAFGAKIGRRDGWAAVTQILATEPVVGNVPEVVHPSQLGGTRHLSAAQFVHDQRDSLALVASQDGRFTVFSWSECEGMVEAHSLETMLL
ncbi:MAG: hypothetical protein H7039_09730 [Bryobacteraceae bacterium]|nr:hypothetical protein [Bryobacteraceae bacterium]